MPPVFLAPGMEVRVNILFLHPQGPIGYKGLKGLKGEHGSEGQTGKIGKEGPPGPPGMKGMKGAPGNFGRAGEDGRKVGTVLCARICVTPNETSSRVSFRVKLVNLASSVGRVLKARRVFQAFTIRL